MSNKAHDQLSKLPTELLVLIFQQSTDFSSLWSLIHTSSYLSSVFDDYACMIGNAILNTKVPSPTRALMQAVLSLHKGTFLCRTPEDELYQFTWSEVPLLPNVSGTSSNIRWIVRLAHYVHVHAHLYIELCMQKCLQSSLGDRQYPEGFEIPTWTEEQRALLGFWRLVFLNQLREELHEGSLRWPARVRNSVEGGRQFYDFSSLCRTMQTMMALDYLVNFHSVSKSEQILLRSKIFKIPPFPKEREFCWDSQPPPSWEAIAQGREPDEIIREPPTVSNTALSAVTDPEAEEQMKETKCQVVGSGGESEEESEEEQEEESSEQRSQERIQEASQDISQGFSQDANQGRGQQPDEELELRSPSHSWWYRSSSSSSESEEEVYFFSDDDDDDHDDEGDDDDENEDSDDYESNRVGAAHCILRSPSETDSDEYEFPWKLQIRNRPIEQYRARPVQAQDSTGKKECLDLERPPLGLQFWDSMILNPEGGPGKYIRFEAYSQYGILLWEEWRMVEFGLWSNGPIGDMSAYYQKWFRFLCPEDMKFHQKFRFVGDRDWL